MPACRRGVALSSVVLQQARTSPTAADGATAYSSEQTQLIPRLGSRGQGWDPSLEDCSRQTPGGAELQVGGTRELAAAATPGAETSTLLASRLRSPSGGQARVCDGSPALLPKG